MDYWDNSPDLEQALNKICVSNNQEAATKIDMDRILKDIPYQRWWRVFEVGCGVGRLILPMRHLFSTVEGVDYSAKMVELSKDYLRNRTNGQVWKNDGRTLPVSSNNYDFVFAFTVFQHIRSVEVLTSYLAEMYRVVRFGGWVRFQLHDTSNPAFGRFDEDLSQVWGNAYTPDELRVIMETLNYKNIEIVEESPWQWITARKL